MCILFFVRFFQDIDVRKIAGQAVEIQAVTQDELAGYLKAHIFRTLAHGERIGLEEQRDHFHALGIMFGQFLAQLGGGDATVDDVLDDEHVAARDVLAQAHQLLHVARRFHALVGLETDEGNLGIMQVARAEQVGSKDEGTVEYTQEQGILIGIVTLDFLGKAMHLLGNFFTSDVRLKRQALISYFFHLFTELKYKGIKKFSVKGFQPLGFFMEQGK